MRVGAEYDQPFLGQGIDGPLHRLPRQSHGIGNADNGSRSRLQRDGAQHLPARAGQADPGDQRVAGRDDAAIEAENFQDQIGKLGSPRTIHDIMLSY